MEKNKNMGILFIVLSAFSFAWMSTFVRLAGDLPSVEKSFFRNLVAVGVAAFTMIRSKEKIVMGRGQSEISDPARAVWNDRNFGKLLRDRPSGAFRREYVK